MIASSPRRSLPIRRRVLLSKIDPCPQRRVGIRSRPDRTPVESGLTAWEEDDSREELREAVRSSACARRERPLLKTSVQGFFVLNDETQSTTPGGRRGPPPRMPLPNPTNGSPSPSRCGMRMCSRDERGSSSHPWRTTPAIPCAVVEGVENHGLSSLDGDALHCITSSINP